MDKYEELEQQISKLDKKIDELQNMLVNLSLNTEKKFREINQYINDTNIKTQENQDKIIKLIKSDVEHLYERFGVKFRFIILKEPKKVIANHNSVVGVAKFENNPYYGILLALESALNSYECRDVDDSPLITDYTEEEMMKELGGVCDVKIIS